MMNSYKLAPLLDLTNKLKQGASREMLVDSQADALSQIEKELEEHRLVALSAGPSSGKTFLAWVLANEGYSYTKWPLEIGSSDTVVVDDAPSDRVEARSARAHCRLNGISKCVLLTRHPLRHGETVPQVAFSLTNQEEEQIINRWMEISNYNINPEMNSLGSARTHLNRY